MAKMLHTRKLNKQTQKKEERMKTYRINDPVYCVVIIISQ